MIGEWFRRFWYLMNRRRLERTLLEEMEAHREMMREPIHFGNTLRLREASHDVWGWNWLDDLCRQFRYAVRVLRREPTFALTAVLTLALGIATSTTAFSIADAELWRPLPFSNPDRLVAIYSRGPGQTAMADGISGAELLEWRAGVSALSDVAAVGRTARRILQRDTAEPVLVTEVTPNYFATLGRPIIAGSGLTATDAGRNRIAVLTDRAWRRLFGASGVVIGSSQTVGSDVVFISGIVQADESLGPEPDLFIALDERASSFLDRTKPLFYNAVGRLRPAADAGIARVQLQAVAARSAAAGEGRNGHVIYVEDLRDYFTGHNWRPLYFFLGASLIVLLLSIVNVATLLLARAFGRIREFAVRGALGGAQSALARQLLVEGGLLAVSGAAGGFFLTISALRFFTTQLPPELLLRGTNIPVDFRVVAFVVGITGLVTAGFVLAPLMAVRRFDLSSSLGHGSRTGRLPAEGRMRGLLLTAQIAMTVVLLSGAGIFLKSFVSLTKVPLGFDPVNAAALRASLSGSKYATDAAVGSYWNQLLEGARAIPGVRLAAIGSSSPLGSGPIVQFTVAGKTPAGPVEPSRAILRAVSPAYFEALGIRILRGRKFADADTAGAERVAIVNETLARTAFGAENPLGRVIELVPGARTPWTNRPGPLVIIGVVSNVKQVGLNEVEFGDIHVPFAQAPAASMELIVRAGVPLPTLSRPVREYAARLDPGVPVSGVTSFEQRVSTALQSDRVNTVLIGGFACVALLLATIGVYGVVAYNVQARTKEIGVRLALGAHPRRLIASASWYAGRFAIVGAAFGLAGTLALAGVLGDALYLVPGSHTGLLYNVTTTDPSLLGAAFVTIIAVAVLAGAIPASRITRVAPASVLRND
jgi:predicted permease